MAERAKTRGLSLRTRLMLSILVSALISLLAFAATAYVVVSLEERDDLSPGRPPETPAEIATETAEEMLLAMALATPVALLLSLGGAIWVSRRTLAPLEAVVRTADAMSAHDLHRRLDLPSGDPELAALVAALNELFERLELGVGALERHAVEASHELRTPLAVLATELEVALRHERSPAQWQQVAESALDEVRRLTRIVEALLALARLDALPLSGGAAFDLHEAVANALELIGPQAATARISISVDTNDRAPLAVRGNADAFAIALESVLANAVRYTPAGGTVQVSIALGPEGEVDVQVDDSGPGVSDAEREAIFEPFGRGAAGRAADQRDGAKTAGLGLGLAMVRRVAERHGGTVTIDTSPLGGARFTLRLPAAPS